MKNNFIRLFTVAFCFITLNSNLNAQCSEIYFYRFNGLQCDQPIVLSQDGERIATVRLGDRYKATVCSPGQYEFVVKTNEDNMSLIKTSVDVQTGNEYYIKIGCTIGVEVATISKKSKSKGTKDWKKGSKFKGAVQNIQLKDADQQAVVASGGRTLTPRGGGNGNGFKKSQIVGNFQFDVVDVIKAGDMISMSLKVTNLSSEDLVFYSAYYNIYFYDDMGNLLSANDLCIVNDCEYGNRTITEIQKHALARTESLMPYGIPMNMSFNIKGIRNGSKKFTRGVLQVGSYHPDRRGERLTFEVPFHNVIFPELIDPNNPKKRNFGAQSIELLNAKRLGAEVITQFEFQNKNDQPTTLDVQKATAYDDLGNAYEIADIAFGSMSQRKGYARGNQTINSNSKTNVFLMFKNVSDKTRQFTRLRFQLSGFTLDWSLIDIMGEGQYLNSSASGNAMNSTNSTTTTARPNYIAYRDFETKVRNNENVVGKKIILENIYFNSGSDDILNTSYSQLDQLAQLLQSNGGLKVEVSGHTDDVGEDIPNMLLSQKRADSIKYYLIGKSVDPSRITSIGKGKTEPIQENSTEPGRKENRRVEIEVIE